MRTLTRASQLDLSQQALAKFFARVWREWKDRRARLASFDRADPGEIGRIAGDLGISANELRTLLRRGPHAADILVDRLRSLTLDQAKVHPAVMRDLQRCCSSCTVKQLLARA